MSHWRLDGLVALITGSTKGIGLACAEEFLQLGASVVITGQLIVSLRSYRLCTYAQLVVWRLMSSLSHTFFLLFLFFFIIITARNQENVDQVVRTLEQRLQGSSTEQRVLGISGDLSSPDDRGKVVAFIESSFGKLDCLVRDITTLKEREGEKGEEEEGKKGRKKRAQ